MNSPASSDSSTQDEGGIDAPVQSRGRQDSLKTSPGDNLKRSSATKRRPGTLASQHSSSGRSGQSSPATGGATHGRRASFTRSHSPAVGLTAESRNANGSYSSISPSINSRLRSNVRGRVMLPTAFEFRTPIPFTLRTLLFTVDSRKSGESLLLIGSLIYSATKLSDDGQDRPRPNVWISIELYILVITSLIYALWTHTSIHTKVVPQSDPVFQYYRPSTQGRETKRNGVTGSVQGKSSFVWMTVPKNYRECHDDGVLTGILLGPLIASALLLSSLHQKQTESPGLNSFWRIEGPAVLPNSRTPLTPLDALILSRRNLVDLATFCSTLLLAQVIASWIFEWKYTLKDNALEGERASVPRQEGRKVGLYILFTFSTTLGALCIKALALDTGLGIWQNLSYFEIIFSSTFFQLALYIAIRLAHRGFTVGELGLVCFGGIALSMELLNLTKAKIWPVTTPFIKTYRLPTPLLVLQVALIAGSFLVGFMLSPLLWLSRHIAQKPVRRLRFPQEKQRHRRALAVGFYGGSVLIVGGLIGMWSKWCLEKRDPWLWVIFWVLEGNQPWTRPLLLGYWGLLGSLSVAGWNRQLARSRRFRPRNATSGLSENVIVPVPEEPPSSAYESNGSLVGNINFPNIRDNLPNLPNGANVSLRAQEVLNAADKHVPTLSLNARRKFFHALAVAMFLPGVAIDPAFTHLSFSAAFALFTFAEYVRYFAIYPFGAAVHLFMNEFLDHKDSGTAILSHFYLLTGCAGSVWLEGPSRLLQFSGILALGVGDAMASIVGKRWGRHRWSATTLKTLEGSVAFTLSVVVCAGLLRLAGVSERFSFLRYTTVIALSATLEALSDQNDNLTLPLYMWSMLTIVEVQ